LPSDLHVVGLPTFRFYVSGKKPGAYYFVELEERKSAGDAKIVTRGAFKDDTEHSKEPHLIEFSPFAINHVFQAGNQIKLRIASRDYPFFLPNLDQPKAKIYFDDTQPSAVVLLVVP
jgi:predicted acyl esterase